MAAPVVPQWRYFIVYCVYDGSGTLSIRNGIVRASAALDQMEHIERLEQDLSGEAGPGGSARLVHFILLGLDPTTTQKSGDKPSGRGPRS